MKRNAFTVFGIIGVVVCGFAGFYLQRQDVQPPQFHDVSQPLETPANHDPGVERDSKKEIKEKAPVADTPSIPPTLEGSDETLLQALDQVFGGTRLNSLFNLQGIIRRFVVTVVNATDQQLPRDASIFKPLADEFIVDHDPDGAVLSPKNYARYSKYVKLLSSVEAGKLVKIYAHYYSAFESAYLELGMTGYFNDRLVEAIDNTLAAPDEEGPVKLIHQGYYKFANPQLESLSAAQKVMIRMGLENETLVKTKLRQIRSLLTHLDKA